MVRLQKLWCLCWIRVTDVRSLSFLSFAALTAGLLQGCAVHNPTVWEPAQLQKPSQATIKLNQLPPPGQRIAIAVYNFTDQTGQFKPSESGQTLSRAVTQGATSILVEALQQAGDRNWFTVIERERLDNVLRERAVIREMRASYLGEKTINPQALPPLLFAGLLLEGGIIGYDSSTKTGGAGGRFLGIGGKTQYREDTVTVYLRAVSVKTGEVLSSVSVRKSIASTAIGADAFRYVAFKQLIELEAGVTYNEPDQLALRQAIEEAVYSLIIEGSVQNLWCMNAPAEQTMELVRDYLADLKSVDKDVVRMPLQSGGGSATGSCATQVAIRQPQTARTVAVAPPQQVTQSAAISARQNVQPAEALSQMPAVAPAVPATNPLEAAPAASAVSDASAAAVVDASGAPKSAPLTAWLNSQAMATAPKSIAQTSVPQTRVPQTSVPQTSVPQTSAPQTNYPPLGPPAVPDRQALPPAYRAPEPAKAENKNRETLIKETQYSDPVPQPK
jgi:curli production assembly/transport component CsgG